MNVFKGLKPHNPNNPEAPEISSINPKANRTADFLYPSILALSILTVLLFIESKHSYFFLQDDNRDSYLPYFVHNYRSLLNGELALYNFHQFMGIPALASGQTGSLYPITYFAVFLSNAIFRHPFAAVDIQVILHLMIGSVGFYSFIKFLVKDHKAAFFGGLTWSLSSFIIYVSNSWVIVSAVAAYFPWMMLFSFRLYKTPTSKVNLCAVSMRLLLFYAGHIQYFIYSVIFEFITTTAYVISNSEPGKKKAAATKYLIKYFQGYIYVFIFSLPLLLPMWHHATISAGRSGRLGFEIFVSQYFPVDQLLKGLFYPFLQVDESTYAAFRNLLNLSHIGYITIVLLFIGIADRYVTRKNNIKINSVKISVFTGPALLAFFWATNRIFNYAIYQIPILNRLRWPFKLAFYLDFYLIVIAALVLSYIINQLSKKETTRTIVLLIIIIIQTLNFGFLYTATPYKDFGEHHSDTLPIEEKLKDQLTGGRIISIGFDTWAPTPENNHAYLTAPTLGFNYATLWGLDSFAGYDAMLSRANLDASLGLNFTGIMGDKNDIPVEYLRKAAVRWYIVPKDKVDSYSSKLSPYGIIEKYRDENRVVFYDDKAYPMVFNSKNEKVESEDYRVTTNTIALTIDAPQSETIIFNNIYNPFFTGYVDGEKIEVAPIDDIHMSISVPAGKHHILIRYSDPYLISGIYFVLAFLIFLIIRLMVQMIYGKNKKKAFPKINERGQINESTHCKRMHSHI